MGSGSSGFGAGGGGHKACTEGDILGVGGLSASPQPGGMGVVAGSAWSSSQVHLKLAQEHTQEKEEVKMQLIHRSRPRHNAQR